MKTHKVLINNNVYLASQKEMEDLKELYDNFKKTENEAGEDIYEAYEEAELLDNYKSWLSRRDPLLKDVYNSSNLDNAYDLQKKPELHENMDDDLPF